jgi:Xaa-Pro dipeptidase
MNLESLQPFPPQELDRRVKALRLEMAQRDLKAAVVISPENIYYLTGLDHYGFFFQYFLLVPSEGELVLVTRSMEAVTTGIMLINARHRGHPDHEHPTDHLIDEILSLGLGESRIGVEKDTLIAPYRNLERLFAGLPGVTFTDFSGVTDSLRQVKSTLELSYIRRAGAISAAMTAAAVQAAAPGVAENEIAAEVMKAMCLAGGNPPGFAPFIRSTPTLGMEHGSWTDRRLEKNDTVFVELSGCCKHYHAPMGRLIFIGPAPKGTDSVAKVTIEAFEAVIEHLREGMTAREVYEKWQSVLDRAGLAHYTRHHCGYQVGLGFPPGWTGGGQVVGLRRHSDMVLKKGMTFHILSWLVGCGLGDYLVTNAAAVGDKRGENLIDYPMTIIEK